ncbi:sphingosine kinase 1 [Podarcis lilfordi]|uniref:sphingosine kinase n=1 Tax=Podarcis lilfordi TaxID=74358 RepID=A0AA35JWP4_9SAUR|nr:sphingosine kinase 1 [Podarcis lilfordi]
MHSQITESPPGGSREQRARAPVWKPALRRSLISQAAKGCNARAPGAAAAAAPSARAGSSPLHEAAAMERGLSDSGETLRSSSGGPSREVVLSGIFSLAPAAAPKSSCALSLTSSAELLLRRLDTSEPSGSITALSLSDCIGCYAFQRKGAPEPAAAYFTVFCYPFKKGWWVSGESRHRVAKTFRVLESQEAEENRSIAETWARKIMELSTPSTLSLQEATFGLLSRPCQVMVLLNPRSGSGRALQLFKSQVQPMLTEANIGFSMFITEKNNHAWDLVRKTDLSMYSALVIMAGDGLLYEVINGLMERPDWESAIQKPLAILPGGSGNALAASLNHYTSKGHFNKEELLMNCTYFLCKGLHAPMDLMSLHTASGKRLFSFLSFGWGFISDVDIASERYRKLGGARFTVGTFQLLTTLQVYKGRLSYLPCGDQSPSPGSSPSAVGHGSPSALHSEQFSFSSKKSLYSFFPSVSSCASSKSCLLEDSLLVPFEQPVPEHWTVAPEEEFVSIICIQHSHLGADLLLAPQAKLYDDAIHLFYVTAGVSRLSMVKFFMAMDKGTHLALNSPYLHYVPVKAFRLEPLVRKGSMTVDGELLPCEPVQGQMHRRLARVISSTGS